MKRLNLSFPLVSALIVGFSIVPTLAQTPRVDSHPTAGIVENTVNGDTMCYFTVVDDAGNRHENIGATFDLCADQDRFLNQYIILGYRQVRVEGCQGIQPCAVTRLETVATEITVPLQSGIYTSRSNTVRIATRDRRTCYQGFSSGGSLTASISSDANGGDRYWVSNTGLSVQQTEPETLLVGQEDNMIPYSRAERSNTAISPSLERCLATTTPFFERTSGNPYSPSTRSLRK